MNTGFGTHIFYLDHHQISQAIKYQYFSQPFVYAALVAGRVSFAVSLLQVIGQNEIVRLVLHGLILGQVLINAIFAGLQIGECSPPAKYWNRMLPGTCMNYHVIEYGGYVQGGKLVCHFEHLC